MKMPYEDARKKWMLENSVQTISSNDEIYNYKLEEQVDMLNAKPWEKDPHYFKEIRISALALLKMVMHARSGGNIEIMGLMIGKILPHTMVVMDSFAVPVVGTETRVDAIGESYEYMTNYIIDQEKLNRHEKVIGWYHSHPGYGCWLSGIDVATQTAQQQYQEPYCAVVVDPIRTLSSGRVDIGAFRTYPKLYKPPEYETEQYQSIPLNKIEDFGVHNKKYYRMEVSYFMSSLDSHIFESLWSKYWIRTLSNSPLLTNASYITNQIMDLSSKIDNCVTNKKLINVHDDKLDKAEKDSRNITCECIHGIMSQMLKANLFNPIARTTAPVQTSPEIEVPVEVSESQENPTEEAPMNSESN